MSLGNAIRGGFRFLDDIRTIPQQQAQSRQDARDRRTRSLLEESRLRSEEATARQLAELERGRVDSIERLAPTLNSLQQSQADAELQRALLQQDRTTQNAIGVTEATGRVRGDLMDRETANRIAMINNQGEQELAMAGLVFGGDPSNPLSQQFLGHLSSQGDANRAHQLALMDRANQFTIGDAIGALAPLAAAFLV